MKILNLYSGLGGNRTAWPSGCVTAVECNKDIANIYKDRFPEDNVIVGDAHQYLLENYNNFDFIWSSPPCQSHSSFRQNICVRFRGTDAIYPDMSLYQQIIFLKHNTSAKWIIENVNPYYKPLINPDCKIGRHLVWSNFKISELQTSNIKIRTAQIQDLQAYHKIDLVKYNVKNKRQLLRNCVDKRIGQHIFNEMLNA